MKVSIVPSGHVMEVSSQKSILLCRTSYQRNNQSKKEEIFQVIRQTFLFKSLLTTKKRNYFDFHSQICSESEYLNYFHDI